MGPIRLALPIQTGTDLCYAQPRCLVYEEIMRSRWQRVRVHAASLIPVYAGLPKRHTGCGRNGNSDGPNAHPPHRATSVWALSDLAVYHSGRIGSPVWQVLAG